MKTLTREELAYYAGVSTHTLRKWTERHQEELESMGMEKVVPFHLLSVSGL